MRKMGRLDSQYDRADESEGLDGRSSIFVWHTSFDGLKKSPTA